MIFFDINQQKFVYIFQLIFYFIKPIRTECVSLFPNSINLKIGFYCLSTHFIFIEDIFRNQFGHLKLECKTHFTLITNIAIQNQNKKVGIEYENHLKIEFEKRYD